jgi:hypothetical protein
MGWAIPISARTCAGKRLAQWRRHSLTQKKQMIGVGNNGSGERRRRDQAVPAVSSRLGNHFSISLEL